MSTLIDTLTEILDEQIKLYEDILAIGKEKKNVIMKNDMENLAKMNTVESSIVNRVNRLEKQRLVTIKDMCDVLSIRPEDFTLKQLSDTLTVEEDKNRILEIRDRLNEIMGELFTVNSVNTALIESSLEYIEFSLNLYKSANQVQNAGYEQDLKNNKN